MIDLKKLEYKLDRALSSETKKSLTNWLKEKRLLSDLESKYNKKDHYYSMSKDVEDEKIELNLENPIFVIYLDVRNLSRRKAIEIIEEHRKFFDIYSNITTWIFASDKTEVKCIFDGKSRNRDSELFDLIEEINKRVEILSESNSTEDFKINIRNWRLNNIIDGKE